MSYGDFLIKQSIQGMLTHQKIESGTHKKTAIVLRIKNINIDAYIWRGFDEKMIDDMGDVDGAVLHVLKNGYRAFTNFDISYLAMKAVFERYGYKVIDRRNE